MHATVFCFLLVLIFNIEKLLAQTDQALPDQKSNWNVGMEGMLGASVGKNFYSFNVGGPSLHLRLTKDLKIGVGALPSFYVRDGKTGAKLGVAPRLDYKSWVLIVPFFHFDKTEVWVASAGLGYKFHKKA
ncbi:MAG: hypothetical protein JNK44_01965 [Cyclobacteriaceae bacterium]|nr:hypothetical protein [Cyclobacteriaceae bacterium]